MQGFLPDDDLELLIDQNNPFIDDPDDNLYNEQALTHRDKILKEFFKRLLSAENLLALALCLILILLIIFTAGTSPTWIYQGF